MCIHELFQRGEKPKKGTVFLILVTTASDDDDDDEDDNIDDLYAYYVPVTVLRASHILLNLHNTQTWEVSTIVISFYI